MLIKELPNCRDLKVFREGAGAARLQRLRERAAQDEVRGDRGGVPQVRGGLRPVRSGLNIPPWVQSGHPVTKRRH